MKSLIKILPLNTFKDYFHWEGESSTKARGTPSNTRDRGRKERWREGRKETEGKGEILGIRYVVMNNSDNSPHPHEA